MQLKCFFFAILAFSLLFPSEFGFSQGVKIYGNIGIEGANISVVNTQYGTTSDAKGNYALPLYQRDRLVDLLYSSIGYEDTLVSLSPKMLQCDSLRLSFRMREKNYDLAQVNVSAHPDFFRTDQGKSVSDIAFVNNKIVVIVNASNKTELLVLDSEGNGCAKSQYDSLYHHIHLDCFGNCILVGENRCLQVYLDEQTDKTNIGNVVSFSKRDFEDKLQNLMFEFCGAYIFRNQSYKRDWYVHQDHNKSQTYFYVLKDDPLREKHFMAKFIDMNAMEACQSYLSEIIMMYSGVVPENENVFQLGVWDGNLLTLAENADLIRLIGWYENFEATEYRTTALKFEKTMQLIDFEKRDIMDFDCRFHKTEKKLVITSGEKLFQNQFLTDEATGKTYGVFVKDGVYHVGLYDPQAGIVGMGQKASKGIFPKVFKIHNGYAYSVYFDKERLFGRINRTKID